jgi:hypothetical protein|nr:MAG TPA: hypothetical protein [Caudoviricetes sp.]
MTEKERLVALIFRLLNLIENKRNQSIVEQIRGLLRNLRDLN